MVNLMRRISMEAAGIESRISRGELAELLKDKMERRLEKERKALLKQISEVQKIPLTIPKKYKPLTDEVDKASPYKHTLQMDRFWNEREDDGYKFTIKVEYYPHGQKDLDRDFPRFSAHMTLASIISEPGFEQIYELGLKLQNLNEKHNEIIQRIQLSQNNSFKHNIVESSLAATEDGRALIEQMDKQIDVILEEME
jgi:hypothetical protein